MLFIISSILAVSDFGLKATAEKAGFKTTGVPGLAARVGELIAPILAFVGVIFFALMLYGGIMWMTARGNEEKAKKALELIKDALIGLIIVFGAYVITYFVMSQLASSAT